MHCRVPVDLVLRSMDVSAVFPLGLGFSNKLKRKLYEYDLYKVFLQSNIP